LQIYLDNAATTQPLVSETLQRHMESAWYNPSAAYAPAEKVFIGIKHIRQALAEAAGMAGCVFTSGGTEANNTAVRSSMKPGAHYITSALEHPSVYETFRQLAQEGAQVDFIKPRGYCIDARDVAELVRENTAFVSVMHVNNETGAINDIKGICAAVKAKNPCTLFHSDGVQALLKTQTSLSGSGVDFYTVSAHKIHALKGTGALLSAKGRAIKNLMYGGGQEGSLRPGTENTLGIQAFGEALEAGLKGFDANIAHVAALHDRLVPVLSGMEGARLHLPESKVPHIVNVSFEGLRAEVLARLLGEKGICVGTGAACSRGKISRTLTECGVKREEAEGAIRISFSAHNTQQETDIFLQELEEAVKQLRRFGRR
jgi:cysteine desulfurase